MGAHPRHRSAALRLAASLLAFGLLATACSSNAGGNGHPAASTPGVAAPGPSATATPGAPMPWDNLAAASPAALAAGSNPSVLPSDLLIADKKNNRLIIVDPQGRVRWQFPRKGDLAPGQTFPIPDDAFFSPDGKQIIATEEDNFVISVVDIASHRIVYRYGTPAHAGSTPDHLNNPDDAMMLPDGYLLSPDIKNCRILLIPPGGHAPARIFGHTMSWCVHQPPHGFGSPNGAFPLADGNYLITEIHGDWVDEMNLSGKVLWSTHPPNVAYPSDTNEISPDRYLTVDYSSPGQVVMFNKAGQTIWRYRPTGRAALDHPSLALPLPNGDVIITDDFNHRVIVVDPHTDRVVWQYGHTGQPSARVGYLNNPDGIDLVPPYSLLGTHAAAMSQP